MPSIKLPLMDLPHFDGEFKDWLEYRDVFESVIHKNPALPTIQKYQYLRSSLKGSAAQIISNLEFSQANYVVAWDLICNRYNNSRILIQNHVKSLFNLDKVHEESAKVLRKMIDDVCKHLRALQVLGESTEYWDTLIIHLVSTKLDNNTLRAWEQYKHSSNKALLVDLYDFLRSRADILESIEQERPYKSNKFNRNDQKAKSFVISNKKNCPCCNQDHFIQNCQKFAALDINERIKQVKRYKLCLNCLRSGHFLKECKAGSCKHCNGKHNSILHISKQEATQTSSIIGQSVSTNSISTDGPKVNSCTSKIIHSSVVLLSTARVFACGQQGHIRSARVLIDNGSESSFITQALADELKVEKSRVNIKVVGIGDVVSAIKARTSINVKSQDHSFNRQLACYIVPQITSTLLSIKVNISELKLPNNITLADDGFHIPNKIDILIGADYAWDILIGNQIKLSNKGPSILETKFGWVISGPIPNELTKTVRCNFTKGVELDKQLTRFWQLEQIPKSKCISREEQRCENHFIDTTTRNAEGRFIVKIPLKMDPRELGNSIEIAQQRFLQLERKFEHNDELKREYMKFIDEYIAMGHIVTLLLFPFYELFELMTPSRGK